MRGKLRKSNFNFFFSFFTALIDGEVDSNLGSNVPAVFAEVPNKGPTTLRVIWVNVNQLGSLGPSENSGFYLQIHLRFTHFAFALSCISTADPCK